MSAKQPLFGEQIPYADPGWYQGFASPFHKETHRAFRAKVREFVEKHITPFVSEWEEAGGYPKELHQKAYEAGIYGAMWPVEYGGTPPPDYDIFHELIVYDEFARCGASGIVASLILVCGIGLPPILAVGSRYLKDKVCRDIITGKKVIALAVTEVDGGSDVAQIKTTARREGDFYVVSGQKKFISAGTIADYFTTAVQTGSGHSLLLIERNTPGITVRRLKTQGWWTSGTTLVVFEDVRVPVQNLIGKENEGFKYIMLNFNHERLVGVAMAVRGARMCIEDSIKYARLRETFGKKLIQHQVIRHKIAEMSRLVEATQSWLDNVAYQVAQGVEGWRVAGSIALLKVQATKTMEFCAREASQVLGGASYLRSGLGERVERIYREVRVAAIGGGSEEILLDLAMRQAKL